MTEPNASQEDREELELDAETVKDLDYDGQGEEVRGGQAAISGKPCNQPNNPSANFACT
jgi:hypothetical protein